MSIGNDVETETGGARATEVAVASWPAVGLSADVHHIRRAGLRPLALGAALWLTVG